MPIVQVVFELIHPFLDTTRTGWPGLVLAGITLTTNCQDLIFPYKKETKTGCNGAVNANISPLFLFFSLSSFSRHRHRPPPPHPLKPSPVPRRIPATMSSIIQSFQKSSSLPVSQTESKDHLPAASGPGMLRRRLSALSLKLKHTSSPAKSWTFPRSKSLSSAGEYAGSSIKKWWDWGWSWVLSKKPTFARDIEMNEEETRILGCHNKGSWRHVFYKARSEIRKLVGSDHKVGLPQTCRYNPLDYSKNFDDGKSYTYG
ncbi:hypothetical protein V6N13_102621 [Hibiscus sabdariffa]